MFEECLARAKQMQPDFVLYAGDMFDTKHTDPAHIRDAKNLLQKFDFRPLSTGELMFPAEDAAQISGSQQSIPFIQICGNHESPEEIDLLYTSKVNSVVDDKIIPFIFELRGQIMVLYGLNYQKNLNYALKARKLRLVPPSKFFDKFPVLKAKPILTLLVMHQDNCKLTELFDFGFLKEFNQSNPNFAVKNVINGHEHQFDLQDSYSEQGELHVVMPGTFSQTKRQLSAEQLKKVVKQNLLVVNQSTNGLTFTTHGIFTYQVACKTDISIDMQAVFDKEAYVAVIREQICEVLAKTVAVYEDFGEEVFEYGFQMFHDQFASEAEFATTMRQLINFRDLKCYQYLPKPFIKITISPFNFDYSTQLMLNALVLEDELKDLKQYFASYQRQIVDVHNYEKRQRVEKKVSDEIEQKEAEEPKLKTLQFADLVYLNNFMTKEINGVHAAQEDEGGKATSAAGLAKQIDTEVEKLSKIIEEKILALGDDDYDEALDQLVGLEEVSEDEVIDVEPSDEPEEKKKPTKKAKL